MNCWREPQQSKTSNQARKRRNRTYDGARPDPKKHVSARRASRLCILRKPSCRAPGFQATPVHQKPGWSCLGPRLRSEHISLFVLPFFFCKCFGAVVPRHGNTNSSTLLFGVRNAVKKEDIRPHERLRELESIPSYWECDCRWQNWTWHSTRVSSHCKYLVDSLGGHIQFLRHTIQRRDFMVEQDERWIIATLVYPKTFGIILRSGDCPQGLDFITYWRRFRCQSVAIRGHAGTNDRMY